MTRLPKVVEVKLPSEVTGKTGLIEENLDLELIETDGVESSKDPEVKPKKKQLNLF
jgi:hypothetical protein